MARKDVAKGLLSAIVEMVWHLMSISVIYSKFTAPQFNFCSLQCINDRIIKHWVQCNEHDQKNMWLYSEKGKKMQSSKNCWDWNQWVWWLGKTDLDGLEMWNVKTIVTGSNTVHYSDGDRSETEWTWWVSIWLMISDINMMTNMPKCCNIFRFVLILNKIRQKLAHPGLTVDFSGVAFKHSWPCPWPWIRSYGIPSCITHWALSTYQISLKSEKLFRGRTICRDTSKFKVTWHKK